MRVGTAVDVTLPFRLDVRDGRSVDEAEPLKRFDINSVGLGFCGTGDGRRSEVFPSFINLET